MRIFRFVHPRSTEPCYIHTSLQVTSMSVIGTSKAFPSTKLSRWRYQICFQTNCNLSSSHRWKIRPRMCAMCSQPCWERKYFSPSLVQLCMFAASFCTLFRSPLYHYRTFVLIYDFIFAHFPIRPRFTARGLSPFAE